MMQEPISIPNYITKYFWGDDLKDLNIEKNKQYIIQTLLERGDQKALKWLFSVMDTSTIKQLLPSLKLSKKSGNFWEFYLA